MTTMTSASIRYDLYMCNLNIDDLRSQIRQLETDIAELEKLQKKFSVLHEDFIEEYTSRSKMLKVIGNIKNVKMAATYYAGMNDLINGTEYYKANNGIVKAQRKINNKIRQLKSELDEAEKSLSNALIWRNRLEYLLDEEVTDEGNIEKYYY